MSAPLTFLSQFFSSAVTVLCKVSTFSVNLKANKDVISTAVRGFR